MKKEVKYLKLNEIEYCQAELGGDESTDSLATKRVEVLDTSFREGAGASNTLGGDLVEVHEKGNSVFQNLMKLNIVRLNLEELNQQIP